MPEMQTLIVGATIRPGPTEPKKPPKPCTWPCCQRSPTPLRMR